MSRSALRINVLGAPTVEAQGLAVALSPGATMLCAYLALAPKEGQSRALAASALFANCPDATARRRLNTALWRLRIELREATGVDALSMTGPRNVGLSSLVKITIDAAVFADLVSPVLSKAPCDITPKDASKLEAAVTLHRGQLLEPCHDEWVMAHRHRIENMYLTALDYLLQYFGARGELGAVGKYGDMAFALEPLREDIHRHLMSAYAAGGRLDLVDSQYERCRALLLAELGADPLPETTALYSRLTRGEHTVPATVAVLAAELHRAKREITRLSDIVDRSLEHLARLS